MPRNAFTLLELMVAVVVATLLAGVGLIPYQRSVEQARNALTKDQVRTLQLNAESQMSENRGNVYMGSGDGLQQNHPLLNMEGSSLASARRELVDPYQKILQASGATLFNGRTLIYHYPLNGNTSSHPSKLLTADEAKTRGYVGLRPGGGRPRKGQEHMGKETFDKSYVEAREAVVKNEPITPYYSPGSDRSSYVIYGLGRRKGNVVLTGAATNLPVLK